MEFYSAKLPFTATDVNRIVSVISKEKPTPVLIINGDRLMYVCEFWSSFLVWDSYCLAIDTKVGTKRIPNTAAILKKLDNCISAFPFSTLAI